jgi:hypothetical protein
MNGVNKMKKSSPRYFLRVFLALLCFSSFWGIHNSFAQTPTYTVGGSVSGLASGKFVVLRNNTSSLTVSANGAFTFPAQSQGTSWNVTVGIQPSGQLCRVISNASGTNISANITNVSVSCVNSYTVSGTISGLNSSGLVLRLNNISSLMVSRTASSFRFSSSLLSGSAYSVSVGIQPPGYKCTVANGTGTIGTSNITNVSIACTNGFTIGGTITGLNAAGLVLKLNNSASKIVQNGATSFSFSSILTSGTPYSVTVSSQPTGKYCYLTNALSLIHI